MGRGFGHKWGKVWFLSANDAVSKATHLHQNVELGLPTRSRNGARSRQRERRVFRSADDT
jgi:hypothetical protein